MFGSFDDSIYSEKKIALAADPNAMVEELLVSDYGEHNMLVYPNRRSFRQLYSKYCRSVLLNKSSNNSENETIVIISYYDTIGNIRNVLKRIGIDLGAELRKMSIIIMDSVTAYSYSHLEERLWVSRNNSENGSPFEKRNKGFCEDTNNSLASFPILYRPYRLLTLLGSLMRSTRESRITGLCVIADMGSFYLLNKIEELVDYESSYNPKFDVEMNVKAFCCHHRQEIKRTLTVEQRDRIFSHHNRNLLLLSS